MHSVDQHFNDLVEDIRVNGVDKADRTGVGSRSVFGRAIDFDIRDGRIPLPTQKKVAFKKSFHEMIWWISGEESIAYLKRNGVNIWDQWIDPNTARYDEDDNLVDGIVEKVYGHYWRHWIDQKIATHDEVDGLADRGYEFVGDVNHRYIGNPMFLMCRRVDQLMACLHTLTNKPDSRRIIMTAWNPGTIDQMGLPPCHYVIQFWTRELTHIERIAIHIGEFAQVDHLSDDFKDLVSSYPMEQLDEHNVPRRALSGQLNMRSQDLGIGWAFNIAQYTLLLNFVAKITGMATERLRWIGADVHIYSNQWDAVAEQLANPSHEDSDPRLDIEMKNPEPGIQDIEQFTIDDISVVGYRHSGRVKYPAPAG